MTHTELKKYMLNFRDSEVASTLKSLRRHGPACRSAGICAQPQTFDIYCDWFDEVFDALGVHKLCPIPHPLLSNIKAYSRTKDLWDYGTPYGANRLWFLDRLIEIADGRPCRFWG